jgi:hypothetical protein
MAIGVFTATCSSPRLTSLADGVGAGVAVGAGSLAGVGSAAGAGVGVAVGAGFTGADDTGGVDERGGSGGAVSVPAALRMAAMNASADCGVCTAPVRMVLKSTMRP